MQPHGTIATRHRERAERFSSQGTSGSRNVSTPTPRIIRSRAALYRERNEYDGDLRRTESPQPYVKDAIDRAIVRGERNATNPARNGFQTRDSTYTMEHRARCFARRCACVSPATSTPKRRPTSMDRRCVRYDLSTIECVGSRSLLRGAQSVSGRAEEARIVFSASAFAGMLWSKQYYFYVDTRLAAPAIRSSPPPPRGSGSKAAITSGSTSITTTSDLDARHVGIPVVRIVGSRVSHTITLSR